MIDHLLKFASETAAKSDPVAGPYWHDSEQGGSWDDSCIPNVLVWQPASDTTGTAAGPDGISISIPVHHPVADANGSPYWYILISKPDVELALFNAALLTCDRDAANAGQPFVLGSVMSNADLATYMIQPSFAGSNYPFGAPQ